MKRYKTLAILFVAAIIAACISHSPLFMSPAEAQDSGPLLSLDPGGHTATVDQVLFTPNDKTLLSVGEDKVVRVWDATTGAPLRQRDMRGQAEEGPDGKPYAAALSPDGRVLAVGGFIRRDTGVKDDSGNAVYQYYVRLYNPNTGQITGLLNGPHNAVLSLAFSPDGTKLAAGSGDRSVTVWDLKSGAPMVNTDHGQSVYGVAFSPDSTKVASVSTDKTLRIWDLNSNRSRECDGHTDGVRCVAWSPDGATIATGSYDNTIRLWDPDTGKTRQVIQEPKAVTCLAFSPDSRLLASGLGDNGAAQCPVQIWSVDSGRAGSSPIQSFLLHTATVQSVAFSHDTVAGKAVTVASAGGVANEIYIWNGMTGAVKKSIVSTGGAVDNVSWSPDGKQLAWSVLGPQINGGANSNDRVFDLSDQSLVKSASTSSWQGPLTSYEGRTLVRSPDNSQVLLVRNGNKEVARITLTKPGDTVECFAFTQNGQIVLGSSYGLSLYDSSGNELRTFVGHTADVLAVSVSPDGRYLASGSGDQTVKIWPLASADAVPANGLNVPQTSALLSLFVGSDEEWVEWNDFGFYACSPDGENIIGWQVNQGDDHAADYYPASRVGKSLNRPDIISHLLETGDEAKAIAIADKASGQQTDLSRTVANLASIAPPQVVITSPTAGQAFTDPVATIKFTVTDPNGRALKDLKISVNGQIVDLPTGTQLHTGDLSADVPLDAPDNTISILATNDADSSSNPATIRVSLTGSAETGPPNLLLLSIGVSNYDDPDARLNYPAKDATDIAAAFKAQQGKLFGTVDATLLTDAKATHDSVIKQLTTLERDGAKLQDNDYTIVFVAGHGTYNEEGDYYFAPVDVDTSNIEATAVDWSFFTRDLSKIKGHVILMLDTCHAAGVNGAISEQDAYGQFLQANCSLRYNNQSRLVIFSSCDQNEKSEESSKWNNGAFTHAIIEGLSGKADANGDGIVTITELFNYVHSEVLQMTDGKQTPRFIKPNFVADTLPITKLSGAPIASAADAGTGVLKAVMFR